MKKFYTYLTSFLLLLLIAGCAKDGPLPSVSYIKFSSPAWSRDTTGKYPFSMTAVVQVPDSLKLVKGSTDKIGAFINYECRETGVLVKSGTSSMYYILIQGTASESSNIVFKYYNASSQNIYTTSPFLTFAVNGSFGSPDKPAILSLQAIQ